jgi:hypothetical protein
MPELMYALEYQQADNIPTAADPTKMAGGAGPAHAYDQAPWPQVEASEMPEEAALLCTLQGRQAHAALTVKDKGGGQGAMVAPGPTIFQSSEEPTQGGTVSAALNWLCTGSAADDLLRMML